MSTEKVDAWMPLWIGSYLADTMHLSRDSHGGYLLLLFAYWRNKGPLVDDDEDLAGITKATPKEWKKLRPRLAKFFEVSDGVWRHGRADKELFNAGSMKAAAVERAKAGAEARWGKARKQSPTDAPSMPEALPEALPEDMLKQCPTPSPIPEDLGDKPPASFAREIRPEVAVCIALRQAGCQSASASHPKLMALVAAGATPDEFVGFLAAAQRSGVSDGFAYVMKAVEESRKRAKAMIDQIHHGALPDVMTPGQAAAHARIMAVVPSLAARKVQTATQEIFDVTARRLD